MSGAMGRDEGIEHGTPRGFRQHKRRHVPVCPQCQEAHEQHDRTDKNAAAFNGSSLPVRDLTARERHRAARFAASRATGAGDLRELLSVLGLTAADGKPRAGGGGVR